MQYRPSARYVELQFKFVRVVARLRRAALGPEEIREMLTLEELDEYSRLQDEELVRQEGFMQRVKDFHERESRNLAVDDHGQGNEAFPDVERR